MAKTKNKSGITAGEKKVKLSSPIVTISEPVESFAKNGETPGDSIKDKAGKNNKNGNIDRKKDDVFDQKEDGAKRTTNRLNAQTLAMLLKLVSSEDGSSASSSSSSSSDGGGSDQDDTSSSSSTSSSSDNGTQSPKKPIALKSSLKKTLPPPLEHAGILRDDNDPENTQTATPHSFTAVYAGLYPDRVVLYPTCSPRFPGATIPMSTAATTHEGASSSVWTQEDCDCLSMLEARQRALKWLDLQAEFYNITGKMVSAGEIQEKFEADIARAHRAEEVKEAKRETQKKEKKKIDKLDGEKSCRNEDARRKAEQEAKAVSEIESEDERIIAAAIKTVLMLRQ
ncbi:uncharacterized protein B0I36DRAFT_321046 [Microdochium trichocladiopsis]|uniref:Uncharacterized protein n=1 Tax=Microdochium trichocladiopsis TaxID=1682393 RepID=A0A9P8YBP3_9PEZI|nr:uncharacterized protein B0I36DRAFT_321046 [Microdochium trichocladiopsis]KAH7033247.1 hypothetical protein B0I36DRAFT_321046 [Microdochium trichocladiopsis]